MSELTLIFNWIVVSSIAASILIGVILIVKLIVKDTLSPNWQYLIWLILLIRLLMPSLPSSSMSIFNTVKPAAEKIALTERSFTPNIEGNIQIPRISLPETNNITNKTNHEVSKDKFNLKNILMLIWLSGVFIFTLYTIFINLKIIVKNKQWILADNDIVDQKLSECKAALNIKKDIPAFFTNNVSTPSLFGIFRPVLLIPKDTYHKISDDELKHIFLHELCHFKRKDNLINWVVVILKILHWFNPIIWYGFYKMREDCEIACDTMAMSYMSEKEKSEYGYTLVHLLEITSKQNHLLGTMGILSDKSGIKRRIIMISKNKRYVKFSLLGIAILLSLSCILLTNAKVNTAHADKLLASDNKIESNITVNDIKNSESYSGKVMIIPNPKKVAVAYSSQLGKTNNTTSELAKSQNAIAAINAGAFYMDQLPCGFIIKDGKFIYTQSNDKTTKFDTTGFTDEGKLIIGSYTLEELKAKGVKEAVGYGLPLIINGKSVSGVNSLDLGVGPRTAIGQMADGTVIFLVTDGRNTNSIGATVKDVTDVLLKNGAVNAALLDGGSSSTMYYKGNVINTPSNSSGERKVPSAFVVLP
ncbi:M56 and phosphodiester glycosidase domain-containing protein [Clostridium aciditolerans]|uniref:Phosphodiester glycosidase family protein n=1 Tax=Clostridium aciditolerans TaxID=339861 RepID=A0A934I3F1_9CLOT|nr:M56 and phosphodiester glycosidase domain-containing protein [Clostridium aciditolerans]MBI6875305.1 phosphodiester glycosidase family protein [Clostridium aciditolerans]